MTNFKKVIIILEVIIILQSKRDIHIKKTKLRLFIMLQLTTYIEFLYTN